MAAKPLTTEAIALTEKKMDMALDDIIKLSKIAGTKSKTRQRTLIKNKKLLNNQTEDKTMKVMKFMDSRSSRRQGALAKKRSNFQVNQFPLATEAAQKAVVAPFHNRAFGHDRVPNGNKQRVRATVVHRRPANRGYPSKPQPQKQYRTVEQGNAMPKQRPQTLDSLFANMKEQRLRATSRQKNVVPSNMGGQQQRRARFGN